MDIEGDVLGVCRPMLIAEAVYIFPISLRSERVVAIRNGLLVFLVASYWSGDLAESAIRKAV
jgi:hypothetical protein